MEKGMKDFILREEIAAQITQCRSSIEDGRPLVHCITNYVTVNDCANALLAVGARPVMAHAPQEAAEITAGASALVLNLGATEYFEAMQRSAACAQEKSIPMVMDPVGVAGSSYRRRFCADLIKQTPPQIIRGNAAEIRAFADALEQREMPQPWTGQPGDGYGVDAPEEALDKGAGQNARFLAHANAAVRLANAARCVTILSGAADLITDGKTVWTVDNGSSLMARLTGAGCMASAILGAYLAVTDPLQAAFCGTLHMALAGQAAEGKTAERSGAYGTFHVCLMDQLTLLKEEAVKNLLRLRRMQPPERASGAPE